MQNTHYKGMSAFTFVSGDRHTVDVTPLLCQETEILLMWLQLYVRKQTYCWCGSTFVSGGQTYCWCGSTLVSGGQTYCVSGGRHTVDVAALLCQETDILLMWLHFCIRRQKYYWCGFNFVSGGRHAVDVAPLLCQEDRRAVDAAPLLCQETDILLKLLHFCVRRTHTVDVAPLLCQEDRCTVDLAPLLCQETDILLMWLHFCVRRTDILLMLLHFCVRRTDILLMWLHSCVRRTDILLMWLHSCVRRTDVLLMLLHFCVRRQTYCWCGSTHVSVHRNAVDVAPLSHQDRHTLDVAIFKDKWNFYWKHLFFHSFL